MTLDAYFNPDFTWGQRGIFFLITLAGVLLVVLMICGIAKISGSGHREDDRAFSDRFIQLFYEMIISGTSGIAFASSYVVANHLYQLVEESGATGFEQFCSIWGSWKDFALLLLICLSCVINTILDHIVIPLRLIEKEKKASVRMLGMFYVIVILVVLDVIGDKNEYSPVMMYYFSLMVGRFVYFDASFRDFLDAMVNVFKNLPLMLLGLLLSSGLCVLGFSLGYFLEKNYFILGVLYTHLFMLAAIFVLHHTYQIKKLVGRKKDPQ